MEWVTEYNAESIFELIKSKYKENTGLDLQIGSDGFAIASVVTYVLGVMIDLFNEKAKQRFLATATGTYLDGFGENFDLSRPEATHAVVTCSVQISGPTQLIHGKFIVSDSNGVQFTPNTDVYLTESTDVLFVGYENDSILSENNITEGEISQIQTPIETVKSVSNITISGGASEPYPYTDEGDEAYRAYIIENRGAQSVGGPASAYERAALNTDSRILDAYCSRFNDDNFEAGKAKVFVRTDSTDAFQRVVERLSLEDFRPTGDDVEVYYAFEVNRSVNLRLIYDKKYRPSCESAALTIIEQYNKEVSEELGKNWSVSELAERLVTPNSDGIKAAYVAMKDGAGGFMQCKKYEYITVNLEVSYEYI